MLNAKPKPRTRQDLRSDEEFSMLLWLQEAIRHNLISNWEYEPQSFEIVPSQTFPDVVKLKQSVKIVAKHLHRAESYCPDFVFTLTPLGKRVLFDAFKPSILANKAMSEQIYIDVKGQFSFYQTDERYFSLVRKVMYQATGIWTAKIIPFCKVKGKPKGLFYETFAPDALRFMKKGGVLNSCGRSCPSAVDFIKKTS